MREVRINGFWYKYCPTKKDRKRGRRDGRQRQTVLNGPERDYSALF